MIKKLLNLIYEALGKMMGYKSITDGTNTWTLETNSYR